MFISPPASEWRRAEKTSVWHFVLFLTTLVSLLSTAVARPLAAAEPLVPRSYSVYDNDLPRAVQTVCPGGANSTNVTNSQTFNGRSDIRVTTGSCIPHRTRPGSHDPPSNFTVEALPSCFTPLDGCLPRFGAQFSGQGFVPKCGAPCRSACYPGTGGPNPNDCEFMINSMLNSRQQLFTLTTDNFVLFTHNSCGIGVQNQIAPSINPPGCTRNMLYNYQDVGSIARYLAWNCQAAQNARGGKCEATFGSYQTNIPDYYVQVYAN
ncbi:hypothetical protein CPB86DRAFT_784479 [Serendipita vermifera]|nr:hypothetical protein CPB86DRAFT_784479 [Serendipita vermifera]